MKTVKGLKELIKDLPDDTLIITRVANDDYTFDYWNDADIQIQPMSRKDSGDYKYDKNGKESLVFF